MSLKKFLALGDSYTIGEGVSPDQTWPFLLSRELRSSGIDIADPEIIATTGWRTDELKSAIIARKPTSEYDLVSLLVGVNNQYQGKPLDHYASDFEELIALTIHAGKGNPSSVMVLSIPDYGFTPFGAEKQEEITKGIEAFNRVNMMIAKAYGIRYLDITEISRKAASEPDLLVADKLHPSGKMYRMWVDKIMEDQSILSAFS